jgi:formate dehydrogenase major subunit
MEAIAGDQPFILKPDGVGWLFAPGKCKDGPLPTHYEPVESPVGNAFYPNQPASPTVRDFPGPLNPIDHAPELEYPVSGCTFRLTEHSLSGPMSRFNSWLNELQPEMVVELSPELAAEKGIEHGGWLTVYSPRGAIEARALVTRRLRPLLVGGHWVHQIGIPFHWGFAGENVGAVANDLTSLVADPNVSMHEGKVFVCRVEAGRCDGAPPRPTERLAPWPSRDAVPEKRQPGAAS